MHSDIAEGVEGVGEVSEGDIFEPAVGGGQVEANIIVECFDIGGEVDGDGKDDFDGGTWVVHVGFGIEVKGENGDSFVINEDVSWGGHGGPWRLRVGGCVNVPLFCR